MNIEEPVVVDLLFSRSENFVVVQPTVSLSEENEALYVRQSYVIFVLDIRTGMNDEALHRLESCLLDSCFEFITKKALGISFIVNGVHYNVKNIDRDYLKALLKSILKTTIQDNYYNTLVKVRQTVTDLNKQLEQKDITMIFFMSHVEIDHSLGVKKRSYIDRLNEHSEECKEEIKKLCKSVNKVSKLGKVFVIGYSKKGEEQEDYSCFDRDLMNWMFVEFERIGYFASMSLFNTDSLMTMEASFVKSTDLALLLFECLVIRMKVNKIQGEEIEATSDNKILMTKTSHTKYQAKQSIFIKLTEQNEINYQLIKDTLRIENTMIKDENILQNYRPQNIKINVIERQCNYSQYLFYQMEIIRQDLQHVANKLKKQIISYRRVYLGNGKHQVIMDVNQQLQNELKTTLDKLDYQLKQCFKALQLKKDVLKQQENLDGIIDCNALFEKYQSAKTIMDAVQIVFMTVIKQQIVLDCIRVLSEACNFASIKKALQNKLVRRVNGNPKMMNEIYRQIRKICKEDWHEYSLLEARQKQIKSSVGNCIKSDANFVKALTLQDCLGVVFEVQRPDSAIADPGRLKVRQISPFVMRVSQFFETYQYQILNTGQVEIQGGEWVRQWVNISKKNYQQAWDYWMRADRKDVSVGIMPLYICPEHWKVGKLLMKPCFGWTACGEPLGYIFSQTQTIPFLVLSALIRKHKEYCYQIDQIKTEAEKCNTVQEIYALQTKQNIVKAQRDRTLQLLKAVEQTCCVIVKELSSQRFEEKFIDQIVNKYRNYNQPINRTVDVINNNSAFLSQLYCVIKTEAMQKPTQEQFHNFFKHLVQEQLRRETDGWQTQDTQDRFINKLLNSEVENMTKPDVHVVDSLYYDRFQEAKKGVLIEKTYLDIVRAQIEMTIRKQGNYNDVQRLMVIEYKRLYENKVLWMWYVRFLLYYEMPRRSIYKWKCLDITNSYQLFAMIIQNKKQRRNAKRREAILEGNYVDPFDYYQARAFLSEEFLRVREKKQAENIRTINAQKYSNAADVFVYTYSEAEAAGTLINVRSNEIPYYFRALSAGKCLHLPQKMKMLLLGEYQGVQLFYGWKMSKKKSNILRTKYPYQFQQGQYMM